MAFGKHNRPTPPPRKPATELNERERKFVQAYLIEPNAKNAAIKAGYSAHSANGISTQILSKSIVKAVIAKAQEERAKKTGVTATWVLEQLTKQYLDVCEMNKTDISVLYEKDGSLKSIEEWPELWKQKQMMDGLEVQEQHREVDFKGKKTITKTSYVKKITLSKMKHLEYKLLELIGKHIGVGAWKEEPKASGNNITVVVNYSEKPIRTVGTNRIEDIHAIEQ